MTRKLKPPGQRPRLLKELKRLYEAGAAKRGSEVSTVLLSLPPDVQAVLMLCKYLGRFGDLRVRCEDRCGRLGRVGARERCPKCRSSRFEQTTVGYLDGHDKNRRTCHRCRYQWRPNVLEVFS